MKIEIVNGLLTLNVDMIATLALSILLLLLGYYLKNKIQFFERFCIPAPVIGGLLFAIIALFLKQRGLLGIKLDTTFQSPFMIAFFTTVGLGGSFGLIKKGGKTLIIYWILCCILAVMQNIIGVVFAKLTGIHPLLGIMAGAVSQEGGHGAAAAFGPTAESMGVTGATAVAIAAATFGLIAGGLIGGPIAKYLIDKHKLNIASRTENEFISFDEAAGTSEHSNYSTNSIMVHLGIITVCMTIGTLIGSWFSKTTNFVLPGYVGAMFTAVIFRNFNDKFNFLKLDLNLIDLLGNVGLGIFLSMALMSLKLWELVDLALPMFVILIAQVLFMLFYTIFVVFRCLGRDYDAAVMASGMAGHGLGATPNAIANMSAVSEKYGPSPKAFLIVPLVGAFLIDLVGIPNIIWFMNYFK